MILAQALLRINGHENEPAILQLFNDSPAPSHPFSLHHLVDQGQRLGKGPGHWFGSASIAHALASLVDAAKESQLVDLSVPAVCVVADSCIYRDRVMAMAAGGRGDWDQAVVLLLPLRLGLDSLTASYVPILNSLFESPFCLGILGGHPNRAHYFVGCCPDSSVLLFLDPHTTQPAMDSNVDPSSFHCSAPSCMRTADVDPSLTVGFICSSQAEFDEFCSWSQHLNDRFPDPLWSVADTVPRWLDDAFDEEFEDDDGFEVVG